MSETRGQSQLGVWAPPECPFRITYSLRALDDIRLAVVDAFFSLPRGGAEIGGILLGKRDNQQVSILDYSALDCEHAFGPSFTLSPKDLAHLSMLLEKARKNAPDLQPVGWYHSHTRSEILLSETDIEIHRRYFTAPWQIALVLKPHTFLPTRGGFFFREADGSFRTNGSYREFVLDPLPVRPVPTANPGNLQLPFDAPNPIPVGTTVSGKVIPMPTAGPDPVDEPDPPAFASLVQDMPPPTAGPMRVTEAGPAMPAPAVVAPAVEAPSRMRWQVVVMALIALLAIGAVGFATRRLWLARSGPSAVATSLGLTLTDRAGQLQIVWDRKIPAIQSATQGLLEISESGGLPSATRLETAQLQSGSFTYKRETEKVDVTLSVEGAAGETGRETAGFLGKAPDAQSRKKETITARQRDALAAELERVKNELKAVTARNEQLQKAIAQSGVSATEAQRLKDQVNALTARNAELEKSAKPKDDQIAKLRNDLAVQTQHNRVLSRSLDEARAQIKVQQKKRLGNQNADTGKQ